MNKIAKLFVCPFVGTGMWEVDLNDNRLYVGLFLQMGAFTKQPSVLVI